MNFSLKTVLLAVLGVAIVLAFHYEIALFVDRRLYSSSTVVFFGAAVLLRVFKPQRRTILLIPAVIAFAVFLYACFTHGRLFAFLDTNWPRQFPYPDQLLERIIVAIPSPSDDPNRTWSGIVVAVNLIAILSVGISGALAGLALGSSETRDNNAVHTEHGLQDFTNGKSSLRAR